jgi:hypothetical protein
MPTDPSATADEPTAGEATPASVLLVSERLARAALEAAHQQARDGAVLQSVVAQGVALLYSVRPDAPREREGIEQLLRDTLATLTRSAAT